MSDCIKEPLLKLPKYGIINVHGSFLPYYRGLLPSFWVLYYEEKETGATVHYMNENIDDGDIIIQDKIDISECKTMYEVMNKTKQLGGELMIEAIKKISRTPVTTIKNDTNKGNYFSWPIIEHAKEFHRKGYSLI